MVADLEFQLDKPRFVKYWRWLRAIRASQAPRSFYCRLRNKESRFGEAGKLIDPERRWRFENLAIVGQTLRYTRENEDKAYQDYCRICEGRKEMVQRELERNRAKYQPVPAAVDPAEPTVKRKLEDSFSNEPTLAIVGGMKPSHAAIYQWQPGYKGEIQINDTLPPEAKFKAIALLKRGREQLEDVQGPVEITLFLSARDWQIGYPHIWWQNGTVEL